MEIETKIVVRDVMNPSVITAKEDASITEIAKIMKENNVGSVVIVDEEKRGVGIVTERDICYKVVAEEKNAREINAKDIMTRRIVSVAPEKSIIEAAKLMIKRKIRRLPVVDKDNRVIGIITSSDIMSISPNEIEILNELYNIYSNSEKEISEEEKHGLGESGVCDECGAFTDKLFYINNRYICEDCKEEEEAE